jgi:hypothetical protein
MSATREAEVQAFLDRVDRAVVLARSGKLAGGHWELVAGLRRARFLCRQAPWALTLAARYQIAIESYCERYGVRQ